MDGTYKYTTIVSVNLSALVSLKAYPPAKDEVTSGHAAAVKEILSISTSEEGWLNKSIFNPGPVKLLQCPSLQPVCLSSGLRMVTATRKRQNL